MCCREASSHKSHRERDSCSLFGYCRWLLSPAKPDIREWPIHCIKQLFYANKCPYAAERFVCTTLTHESQTMETMERAAKWLENCLRFLLLLLSVDSAFTVLILRYDRMRWVLSSILNFVLYVPHTQTIVCHFAHIKTHISIRRFFQKLICNFISDAILYLHWAKLCENTGLPKLYWIWFNINAKIIWWLQAAVEYRRLPMCCGICKIERNAENELENVKLLIYVKRTSNFTFFFLFVRCN